MEISSTGIYCRPVCRAKRPKMENCTFFATAAQAERAGYHPCLLCRPELAPVASIMDATANLARRAARMLEENCVNELNVAELAARFGCSGRHLRRAFAQEFSVSPVQYLQTCRLLLAKNLLTDTDLSVMDACMAAGFGSLRRINDLFQSRYHLSPTALRKQAAMREKRDGIALALGYRPPYRWEELLRFLAGRAIAGVEAVQQDAYRRLNGAIHRHARHGLAGRLPRNRRRVKKTLTPRTAKEILQMAKAWRPWRSYATVNLWNTQ